MDQKVLVHGEFQVDRQLACHRCAEPSDQRYDAEIEILVLSSPVRGTEEAAAGDAWVIHRQRGLVGLDDAVREAVFLHEPQRVLCREDCQGLCPVCGINHNREACECSTEEIDPRWAALKELRDRSDDGSAQ